jgi:hypothetical protein
MLWQIQGRDLYVKQRAKVVQTYFEKSVVLCLFDTLYCTMKHCTKYWYNTVTAQFSNLIIVQLLLFIYHRSQQILKMSSTWSNAHVDCEHHLQRPGAPVNGLINVRNALMKCLFIFNWKWKHYGSYVPLQTNIFRAEVNTPWFLQPKV